MSQPLWTPSPERVENANVSRFASFITEREDIELPDYQSLHRWSTEYAEKFWPAVWEFCGVVGDTGNGTVVQNREQMPGARWFPDARLNFAENLLQRRDNQEALVFKGEDQVRETLSFAQVHQQVSRLRQALAGAGVVKGDRVAGYMPNMPATVVAMLAATSLGAVWSSCSPDFGVQGVVDRFGQIEPRILFCVDGYFYHGKRHDSRERVAPILAAVPTIERVVMVQYAGEDIAGVHEKVISLGDFLDGHSPSEIEFERFPFNHPLYIMYSSGTTGAPKCIVHGAGGTLIQHLKEHRLHADLNPGDRLLYFTTCGWMMWNWLVTGLASGVTVLLYDGSPFYPDGNVIFDFIDETRMTHFGTSAKFIDAVKKAGLQPMKSHDLSTLKTILSTGSPLAPESFDFVYQHVKQDVCLSSISGGTDLISCFALGNPTLPVRRGEIQCPGLGMAVDVFDDEGASIQGEKGELVCTRSFPSMPVEFWNDANEKKYRAAYFARFPNVWHHGDYVELTEHQGLVMHGRSDAVLNPGGVRIGTAEIYRQVEQLDEVVEGLVVGQEWDNDIRVVLFVRLREGLILDGQLTKTIKQQIRNNATPRHVPAKVIQIADIPRTKSGKIVELAVRNLVHGRPVKNREALANPEVLDLYVDIAELQV